MSSELRQIDDCYRSIFLADDWAHQRYYGWRVEVDRPGFRVLAKSRLVVKRYLVLMTAEGRSFVYEWMAAHARKTNLVDIIIHDFDSILSKTVMSGRKFHLANQRERLLNTATFVIDLRQSEDVIFSAMTSDYRRIIKKAEVAGCEVEAYTKPPVDKIQSFYSALKALAGTHNLSTPESTELAAMYAEGRAILFVASKGGKDTNFINVYKAADAAYYMHGVNLSKVNDGAGQHLQWKAIRHLKRAGLHWYDLGGIASTEAQDGIYKFKKRFGGQLVDLGSEWRFTSAAVELGVAVAKGIKGLPLGIP